MVLTRTRYEPHRGKAHSGKVVSTMWKVWIECCKACARGIMELSICRGFFSSAQEEASDDSLEPFTQRRRGARGAVDWVPWGFADLSSSGRVTGSRMAEIIK
jgi:hypothetical protein